MAIRDTLYLVFLIEMIVSFMIVYFNPNIIIKIAKKKKNSIKYLLRKIVKDQFQIS